MGNAHHRKQNYSYLTEVEIEALKEASGMSEQEIRRCHEGFMRDCPDGLLPKKVYLKMYEGLFPSGKSKSFGEKMFAVFDKNNSGTIDFKEFIIACSLTYSSDPLKKLELAFQIYDKDKNGTITRKEIIDILQCICELQEGEHLCKPDLNKKVDEILRKFDKDSNGIISKEEFLDGVTSDKQLIELVNFL